MECGRNIFNHVKAFLVKEFVKYLIFKFSVFYIFSASIWYRVIGSTVVSLSLIENLVNLGTSHPLGNLVSNTYSDNGETKLGLCRSILRPF